MQQSLQAQCSLVSSVISSSDGDSTTTTFRPCLFESHCVSEFPTRSAESFYSFMWVPRAIALGAFLLYHLIYLVPTTYQLSQKLYAFLDIVKTVCALRCASVSMPMTLMFIYILFSLLFAPKSILHASWIRARRCRCSNRKSCFVQQLNSNKWLDVGECGITPQTSRLESRVSHCFTPRPKPSFGPLK